MKKIIVTGGLGFIGSNLIELLLKKNFYVVNVDKVTYSSSFYNTKEFSKKTNYKFVKCDINDWDSFNKILTGINFDAVVHLAAIVGDPACKLHSDLAQKTNWKSTKWLVDKCQEVGVSKFIFASTCSKILNWVAGSLLHSNKKSVFLCSLFISQS